MKPAAQPTSRRTLLAGSLAAAVALAGCGASSASRTQRSDELSQQPLTPADVALLNTILALEYHSTAAYTAAIPLLTHRGKVQDDAKQFLSQDLTHASTLTGLIHHAGGTPVMAQDSYDLGRPGNTQQMLALLHSVESTVVAGYLRVVPQLSPGKHRADVASMLANDAQHLSVLRLRLHLSPVPSALVTGRE